MPRNNLPNVILEPLDEPIEIVENIEDLVEHSKKEHVNPFVEAEETKPEPQLNYNNLTAKKLREICKSKGYRNYSKLKKSDLIKMVNGEDITIPEKPKPKQEKIKPKTPIKNTEELKNNLVKDEVLIKNKVEEEVEVEVTNEELEEILEPPPKPKPKRKPTLKPQQPILPPQQPILPPQQPILPPQPKKKPFAFKNYYTIY